MPKHTKPIDPRQFILSQPDPPAHDFVRRFILSQPNRPPEWGPAMEQALRERLVAAGFNVRRCRCMAEHPVAYIRMTLGIGQPPPAAKIRRLLFRVARELGSMAPRGGLNVWVQRERIDVAMVLT